MPAKAKPKPLLIACAIALGQGMSALFRSTPNGGLAGALTTVEGGKIQKPFEWGIILPDESLEDKMTYEVVGLDHGFADVYRTDEKGTIHARRVGFHQGAWVAAEEWRKVYDAEFAERHGLRPEDAGKPRKQDPAEPELPGLDEGAKAEESGTGEPDAGAPEKSAEEVRKEAMRKRGQTLADHATANK